MFALLQALDVGSLSSDPTVHGASAEQKSADEEGQEEGISDPLATEAPVRSASWTQSVALSLALNHWTSVLTDWDDGVGSVKEVLESRTWAIPSAAGRFDRLSWRIGARFDLLARFRPGQEAPLAEGAWSFEARAWETFIDVSLAEGLQLKLGYQVISWGKLRALSAGDLMAARDFRLGPLAGIDSLRIPTPAMVLSWFPVEALTFEVAYSPFFSPDKFNIFGTNYALLGPNNPNTNGAVFRTLRQALDPDSYERIGAELSRLNSPNARPDSGDVAARLTLHGPRFDVGLSAGYIRSGLPVIVMDPAIEQILAGTPNLESLAGVGTALQEGRQLFAAEYPRFVQAALDLEVTLGEVSLSMEGGYARSSPVLVYGPSDVFPRGQLMDVVQGGANLTYAPSLKGYLVLEGSMMQSLRRANDGSQLFLSNASDRFGLLLVFLHLNPKMQVLELTLLGTTSGPSGMVLGKYGLQVTESVAFGVGALGVVGPSTWAASVASFQSGLDQVFFFMDAQL
jgi:hypothetical protein